MGEGEKMVLLEIVYFTLLIGVVMDITGLVGIASGLLSGVDGATYAGATCALMGIPLSVCGVIWLVWR